MIRFFLATSVYNQRQLESRNLNSFDLVFEEMIERYENDGFGWGRSWRAGLEASGRYQVFVAYHNWESAQKTWSRDRGIRYQQESWMTDILTAQIDAFKPDVLFIHSWHMGAGYAQAIRRRFPSLKRVLGYDGIARHNPDLFRGTDLVLAPRRDTVSFYREKGFFSELFKLGFNPDVLRLLVHRSPSIPASFVGSINLGGRAHNERLRLLDHVSQRCPLELFLSLQPAGQIPRIVASDLIHRRISSWRALIQDLNSYRRLTRGHRPPVFGRDMYQTLADSAVSLNCHIDAAGANAGNIRLFEVTGVGSCLLTDWKSNLHEFL